MIFNTITAYFYQLSLNAPITLAGHCYAYREGMLLAAKTESGAVHWGEAAPLPGFSAESPDRVAQEARRVALNLKHGSSVSEMVLPQDISPSVYFAYHNILQSLSAGKEGLPLYRYLNPDALDYMPLCALIDGVGEVKRAQVFRAVQRGYKTLKLKVGRSVLNEEAALVCEILREWGPEISLRLDANRAWTREEALQFCQAVPVDQIAFLEEPVKEFQDLPFIQERTGVACAVDETLQALSRHVVCPGTGKRRGGTEQLRSVVEQARFLVWKPSLCLPIPVLGIQSGVPVILSAAYETGVGTAAILAYAAAFSGSQWAAGVDTYTRLSSDILETPLPLDMPEVDLVACEGTGISVNPGRLKVLWHV
ncbi:MAG: o-succinylbenzoate synthase [Candidatus Hydrogenedentes bacterium ADurb.Bin179]|nr:MAG: o-succinylbenzoate synthase [Candidatus Hydrogenedentes bacterium ADurb.Bin179]